MSTLLEAPGIDLPIIQAPMAGVSIPLLAAAVSNAGGLGSIGVGAVGFEAARRMIADIRAATDRAFNVNMFCNRPAVANAGREAAWIARLAPEFRRFGMEPPGELREIYKSFSPLWVKKSLRGMSRPIRSPTMPVKRFTPPRRPLVNRDMALSGPVKAPLWPERCPPRN
jgi:NAD(P)H-dependent flavin oxidoreductase YrpB (nitropropane dioxygenase family)